MGKIIITVDGGLVSSVVSDDEDIDVEILDYDNMKMADNDVLKGYKKLEEERDCGVESGRYKEIL